jgi:hypothetical protein
MLPPHVRAELRLIAEFLASAKTATVAAALTKLRKAKTLEPAVGQPSIDEFLTAIAPLEKFAELYAKPAFAKDLQSLVVFLRTFARFGLRSFVEDAIKILTWTPPPPPILKENVVERHLRSLEDALGNSRAFSAAYRVLDTDTDVGKLELEALTKRFVGKASSSRSAALKKIWARHHALVAFKAKTESRAGRSAA